MVLIFYLTSNPYSHICWSHPTLILRFNQVLKYCPFDMWNIFSLILFFPHCLNLFLLSIYPASQLVSLPSSYVCFSLLFTSLPSSWTEMLTSVNMFLRRTEEFWISHLINDSHRTIMKVRDIIYKKYINYDVLLSYIILSQIFWICYCNIY